MAVKTERKCWVIGTNDANKFPQMIDDFCKNKKNVEKHYSASTQLVPSPQQVPQGLLQPGQQVQMAVQPYCVLHCIIFYDVEVKLKADVN